ncbi:MAG: hypothetical protein CMJ23_14115 [Phycisphaerae bacterium]|nr:hypothetical protein [Phycisphaerae bacterium]
MTSATTPRIPTSRTRSKIQIHRKIDWVIVGGEISPPPTDPGSSSNWAGAPKAKRKSRGT